jgi:BlaI family penicillinase repressor
MKILWRHDTPVTVRDVYEEVRKSRPTAYTTVMTTMKTLEQKGYLTAALHERAYRYRPARPKQQVISEMVRDFVNRVFNGSGRPLVLHMLEEDQLSETDLRDISRMMGKKR